MVYSHISLQTFEKSVYCSADTQTTPLKINSKLDTYPLLNATFTESAPSIFKDYKKCGSLAAQMRTGGKSRKILLFNMQNICTFRKSTKRVIQNFNSKVAVLFAFERKECFVMTSIKVFLNEFHVRQLLEHFYHN